MEFPRQPKTQEKDELIQLVAKRIRSKASKREESTRNKDQK